MVRSNRDKLKEMVRRKKLLANYGPVEGLSPNYDKNGVITPETEGLGPKYLKDSKYIKVPKAKEVPKKKKEKIYIPRYRQNVA